MQFDSLKFKKTLKGPNGHIFQIDWDLPQGRCDCNELVSSPVVEPNYFTLSYQSTNNVHLPQEILFKTPVTPSLTNIYIIFEVYSDPGSRVILYENSTVIGEGYPMTAYNTDRNNPLTAPESQLFLSPIVSEYGTIIYDKTQGSSIIPKTTGDIGDNYRFILKRDTNYIFQTTPLVNKTDISTNIVWYEVK